MGTGTRSVSSSKGIVTLAEDTVLEGVTALLESIAIHEPSLPVVLIPFSDNVSYEVRALSRSAARTTPRRAYHALRKARWQIVDKLGHAASFRGRGVHRRDGSVA
jgi:hypothetical protein